MSFASTISAAIAQAKSRTDVVLMALGRAGMANEPEIKEALTKAGIKPYARFRDELRLAIKEGQAVKVTTDAGDGYQITEDGALHLATTYDGLDSVLDVPLAA